MNAAQVRAKARMAMKRREEEVEQDELEGGEINLIPYLDIVTNLMLFLLVSVSVGVLGQINTTIPSYVPSDQLSAADPSTAPQETPLQMIVSITKDGMILWSVSQLEGTIEAPRARIARRAAARPGELPGYDYQALNASLYELAKRWQGRPRPVESYEILIQADPDIPYEVIVHTLDAVRRRLPPEIKPGHKLPDITMPKVQKQGDKWVPVESYDSDKHYLFPDIVFVKWSFDG